MTPSRRQFFIRSAAHAAGFAGLAEWAKATPPVTGIEPRDGSRYGPLVDDPQKLLDLPAGFDYAIISRAGQTMDDGYLVPGKPDGMGAFSGPDGQTILIRNHELLPDEGPSPFGDDNSLLKTTHAPLLYDRGGGKTPHRGGTTTIVYDTNRGKLVRQFLSLAGTARNCAGGPTPWNSWISCEETVIQAGVGVDGDYQSDADHGFNFEVRVSDTPRLTPAIALKEMGRFNHEAVAVDPQTSIVYQTEDREDGLLYRFVPHKPGKLAAGGRLQALCLVDARSADMRNWSPKHSITLRTKLPVRWLDLDDVGSAADDLRYRGYDQGAARFARGEGMWYGNGEMFFACTNGGPQKKGQIWKYVPTSLQDRVSSESDGTLELFVEPNDSRLLESADNLTAAPWGDLIVCEDRQAEEVRLIGITPAGHAYTLANSHAQSEFAGAAFSPDGSTLFVNIQHQGLTLAITGPW